MKPGDLILVTGMAHTGTTIVTAILATHPDVQLFVSGGQDFVLEVDFLRSDHRPDNWPERMARVRGKALELGKVLLLKRPWLESDGATFWETVKPTVVVIPAWMRWDQVQVQWKKHFLHRGVSDYNRHFEAARTLDHRGVRNVVLLENSEILKDSEQLDREIGLSPHQADQETLNIRWGLGKVNQREDAWMLKHSMREQDDGTTISARVG